MLASAPLAFLAITDRISTSLSSSPPQVEGVVGVASGFGHTMSLLASGTNSLMFSKRYFLRSGGSGGGGGTISSGMSWGEGFHIRCSTLRVDTVLSQCSVEACNTKSPLEPQHLGGV